MRQRGPCQDARACAASAPSSTRPARARPTPPTAWSRPLRHRGPDGDAVRRIGPATLAHTRLAIIDVAGGDQPLVSEDGPVTLIANGEIYNHAALRAKLEQRGHRFATDSDCEAILHAYEEHGPDCVRELNGIFAFALWDDAATRLVAARDEFGVKPLYWCSDGRRVALASEIGALLHAGLVAARARPHGARPLPRLPLRARPAHALRGDSASCRPPPR